MRPVTPGDDLSLRNPDGSWGGESASCRRDAAKGTAEARALGNVKEGTAPLSERPNPHRRPSEKNAGELIGQTVGVRFREKRDGTTYFLLKVLAVNWKEGGPVPAITADLPGTKGGPPVRSLVTPKDMQQFVLGGRVDPEERNLAMAAWEKNQTTSGPPHPIASGKRSPESRSTTWSGRPAPQPVDGPSSPVSRP